MKEPTSKEVLRYALERLPIFTENGDISLESIAKEFNLDNYPPEVCQEYIVDFIVENSL